MTIHFQAVQVLSLKCNENDTTIAVDRITERTASGKSVIFEVVLCDGALILFRKAFSTKKEAVNLANSMWLGYRSFA